MKVRPLLASLLAALSLLVGLAGPSLASDDFYYFRFTLGTHQDTRWTEARYRQTNSDNNPWKVGVGYSSEGDWAYYSAYIKADNNGKIGSRIRTVHSGPYAPWVYENGNSTTRKTNVRLAIFNPEWSTWKKPAIDGWWDEETW